MQGIHPQSTTAKNKIKLPLLIPSFFEDFFHVLFRTAFVLRTSLICLAAAPRLCFSARTFDLSFSFFQYYWIIKQNHQVNSICYIDSNNIPLILNTCLSDNHLSESLHFIEVTAFHK